jgi:hypothetical protein
MDILVNCFAAFAALCHWRLVVSLAAGLLAAVVLAQLVPWFTGGMGLWLVLFACGVGMLWEGDASAGAAPAASAAIGEARPQGMLISRPVAALGLCLIGMVWGGLIGWWAGALWVGAAAVAVAPLPIAFLWALGNGRPMPWGYTAFAACALLSGVGVLWGLVHAME